MSSPLLTLSNIHTANEHAGEEQDMLSCPCQTQNPMKFAHICIITDRGWMEASFGERKEKKKTMNEGLWGKKSKEKFRRARTIQKKKSFSALKKKGLHFRNRGVERDKLRASTRPNEGSRLLLDSCNELHSILLICTITVHLAKSLSGLHESGEEHPSLVTLNWAP